MNVVTGGISSVRKAAAFGAAVLSSTTGGHKLHTELNMILFHEKKVSESLTTVFTAVKEASECSLKWCEKEEDAILQDMMLRISQVDDMWGIVYQDYIKQYNMHRNIYKHILRGEKMIDDATKHLETQRAKVIRLEKQLEQMKRRSERQKCETLEAELTKAIAARDYAEVDLNSQVENHKKFKNAKVRESVAILARANQTFHEKGLILTEAQQTLVKIYESCKPDVFERVRLEGATVVRELAEKLEVATLGDAMSNDCTIVTGDDMMGDPVYNAQPNDIYDNSPHSDRPLPPIPANVTEFDSDLEDYEPLRPTDSMKRPAPKRPAPARPTHSPSIKEGQGSQKGTLNPSVEALRSEVKPRSASFSGQESKKDFEDHTYMVLDGNFTRSATSVEILTQVEQTYEEMENYYLVPGNYTPMGEQKPTPTQSQAQTMGPQPYVPNKIESAQL